MSPREIADDDHDGRYQGSRLLNTRKAGEGDGGSTFIMDYSYFTRV